MDVSSAIKAAYKLQDEWVGKHPGGGYSLSDIERSIKQEIAWNRQYPNRVTPANARETRGKLILLGKVKKALGPQKNPKGAKSPISSSWKSCEVRRLPDGTVQAKFKRGR
jgi:hypothetical protein